MVSKRIPGIYAEAEGTNPSTRKVTGLATGVMLINSHKGLVGQRDLVTSVAEFLFKYGSVEQAADPDAHRAVIAFLAKGQALYVTRVKAADTAVRAGLQLDIGSNEGGGEEGGGGDLSADRYLMTDLAVDWNDNGAGDYDGGIPGYTSFYNSGTNRSEIQIVMDPASLFGPANKFKIRFTHNTGFPIQLDVIDESLNLLNTPGYISGTELDLRLSSLQATELWTLNLLVLGNASYTMTDLEFFVFGPDADIIEGI